MCNLNFMLSRVEEHYENLPMQYTEIFSAVKMKNFIGKNDIFLIFAQNIHCGYTLIPPLVGSSTHNL